MTMENQETIKLLRECDAGTKMAVASIDEVLEQVLDEQLKRLLHASKQHHEKIKGEISSLLIEYHAEEKEPNPMAKGMSWMKTNMKMGMDHSDATVADLITDGCDMGIKSLHRYHNQYESADARAKQICHELIEIEEKLRKDMQGYL